MKKCLIACLLLFAVSWMTRSVDHHRWPIKTKTAKKINPMTLSLLDIVNLPDPPGITMNDSRYESSLIPSFTNDCDVNEGELITIKGYMHLVAFEDNDDEYHIQLSASKSSGDSCLIVEVPDPKNTTDQVLKKKYEIVRSFIRTKILHGRIPSGDGNVIGGRAYVTVTGQLFFDSSHTHNQERGKKGMRSFSLWEIHPIIAMSFAIKP